MDKIKALDSESVTISSSKWENVLEFIRFCAKEDLQIEDNYFEAMERASELLKLLENK